jgi:hypothetical protein
MMSEALEFSVQAQNPITLTPIQTHRLPYFSTMFAGIRGRGWQGQSID